MNLLSSIGRGIKGVGRGILSGIDSAAQNSLTSGGLLDSALGQDGQPFTPTPQQRGAMRSQYLQGIFGALQQGRPVGEGIQEYQQRGIQQIQAGQQASTRQKSAGMIKQFQAELAEAQSPEARNAVLTKYAPFIGPEATKQYADSFKAMQPDDSFVAVGDLGYLNKKTGAFQAVSRPTAQPTPERQAFENLLEKNNKDATKAFSELQAIMRPPAEQREISPTEASLAVAAANGDPKAIAALKLLQQQKLATQQTQQPSRVLGFVPDGSGGMRAMEVTAGMPVPAGFQTAQGVNSMNTPTAAMRGMGERAATVDDLDAKIRAALENPLIKNGMGPLAGRLKNIQGKLGTLPKDLAELQTDLISYGAFQAGLHPVRGIRAMNYFEKVIGGLGQDPEQLIGKMNSNRAVSQSVQGVAGRSPMQQGAPKSVKRYNPATGRFE